MNIGIALICGNIWSLILAVVISVFTIMTVFKEEAFLQEKFSQEYREYMQGVPWRMIPGIF
jgi:protein-S-isoprenylcysteine O-methyltransferase Ste14